MSPVTANLSFPRKLAQIVWQRLINVTIWKRVANFSDFRTHPSGNQVSVVTTHHSWQFLLVRPRSRYKRSRWKTTRTRWGTESSCSTSWKRKWSCGELTRDKRRSINWGMMIKMLRLNWKNNLLKNESRR